jgi:hypothetical protein
MPVVGRCKNFGTIRRLAHLVRIKLVARRSTASENQSCSLFCQRQSVPFSAGKFLSKSDFDGSIFKNHAILTIKQRGFYILPQYILTSKRSLTEKAGQHTQRSAEQRRVGVCKNIRYQRRPLLPA